MNGATSICTRTTFVCEAGYVWVGPGPQSVDYDITTMTWATPRGHCVHRNDVRLVIDCIKLFPCSSFLLSFANGLVRLFLSSAFEFLIFFFFFCFPAHLFLSFFFIYVCILLC